MARASMVAGGGAITAAVLALLVLGGCDDDASIGDALCDRQCATGLKCAFVDGTLTTTCVSDGSGAGGTGCKPACLSSETCVAQTCVPRTLDCAEILACIGDCPKPDACVTACQGRGSAAAQALFSALDGCASAANCPDTDCLRQTCGAELDACFGVASCSPACAADQVCTNGACTPRAAQCSGLTAAGECQGQTLFWCEDDTVQSQFCPAVGPGCVCAMRQPENYSDCVCDGRGGNCDPPCQPGSVCTPNGCAPGGGGGSSCVPACPPGFVCTPQGCEIGGF